jgi:two-component system, NtrC family, sensor kinase
MSEGPRSTVVRHALGLPRRLSVRYRLLGLALLPTMILVPGLLGLGAMWWAAQIDNLLISKVNGDLTVARQYLNEIVEQGDNKVAALAQSAALSRVLSGSKRSDIDELLAAQQVALGLDFLYLIDRSETVLAASPVRNGQAVGPRSVIEAALDGRPASGIDVFPPDELRELSPLIEQRARLDLVPTPAALPIDRTTETRGMVIHVAAPVQLADGASGALVGGTLLNHNLAFIDTINDLVYSDASLPEGSQGTATLFLDDVRISTNVRLFAGTRALGTRVSEAVRQAVLGEGRIWLDRAFVVNDWYVSAYEPVVDTRGRRIGMLYVGFLEKPFRDEKRSMLFAIAAAFALSAALVVPVLLWWARSIFFPLERVSATIARVERGDLDARIDATGPADEIGRVAKHLDELLDSLQDRDRKLRGWASELESRVAERTRELTATNERLETTRRQLVMSEKLAAIGEITAGVAHEINNPIAVIQGNLDVAREILGENADPVRNELHLIEQQVHRMNLIVTKILQFARPEEFAGYIERVNPATLLDDSLVLVQNELNRPGIKVIRVDEAHGSVLANPTELQQLIVNLIVNAIHAMPDGGTLTLRTSDRASDGQEGVGIDVSDTGVGIAPEHLDRIFNAFFTTRPQRGTGLGLSISATLLARYGGRITVASKVDVGSTFSIWLPAAGAS